ncbi:MAG TPA: imidazolonepropionase [Casimicrobiaceae bacterium]|nr:imidazolonepropionase [Casimicrobiaceae bacterium]
MGYTPHPNPLPARGEREPSEREAGEGCSADGVWRHLRLLPETLDDPSLADASQGSAIVVRDSTIAWLGGESHLPREFDAMPRHECENALVTPGLVDCHTHLVYAGDRAGEFALRLAGASYEEIAARGGGIVSTVRATREASEDGLFEASARRLQQFLDEGVCAIEIKSGYGLDLATERKQLRVARRLGAAFGVTVKTTFLGAHASPPEFAGRSDAYIDLVANEMLPALAEEGLVDAVDVFCERIAFSPSQTARVFDAAKRLGLPVKIHAEQLSDSGGAALAARYHALSADHLEHLSPEGIDAMRDAGTVAVLLPGAFYMLRETKRPPVDALRAAGVPIAVATDHNPGTSPMLSLLDVMHMACTLFGLAVAEMLASVTRNAARALGLQATHGSLGVGRAANFALWELDSPAGFAYWMGGRPIARIVRQGRIVEVNR